MTSAGTFSLITLIAIAVFVVGFVFGWCAREEHGGDE